VTAEYGTAESGTAESGTAESGTAEHSIGLTIDSRLISQYLSLEEKFKFFEF
jgi:hypothetical protein